MTRYLFATAFLIGAAAVFWICSIFTGENDLALAITALIGGIYGIGIIELVQFRRATATLAHALANATDPLPDLDRWLAGLDSSLQNAVRRRIEGAHVGLPAPILTPYLIGLLVMLGLLGTFVGMVYTLSGAMQAIQGAMDLEAIRAGLAAPIRGLGLAFGTSVAGIATSAMLGLMSALCRRDRMLATRTLDTKIASIFKPFSLVQAEREAVKAIQVQTQAFPDVAEKLHLMADKLVNLGEKWIVNQEHFHTNVKESYAQLAASVDQSLKDSIAESRQMTGESIKPLVQDAMAVITQETRGVHQQLAAANQENIQALAGLLADTSKQVSQAWQTGLEAHIRENSAMTGHLRTALDDFSDAFEHMTGRMLSAFTDAAAAWVERHTAGDQDRLALWADALSQSHQESARHLTDTSQRLAGEIQQVTAQQQTAFGNATQKFAALSDALTSQWQAHGQQMERLMATLHTELGALRDAEESRGQAALDRLESFESALASHLAELGQALEAPMTRLIQTAAEAPRAAADVIEQLRQEVSKGIERDNRLLQERGRILKDLDTLSGALTQNSSAQQEAITTLVDSAQGMLADVGRRFSDNVGGEMTKFSDIAEMFAGSAVEMACLGEAFGTAINLFNESNTHLIENLSRIEESLDQAASRSDEQMGYYVAQAREIIDQSMLLQKEVFEQLGKLRQPEAPHPEVN